MDTSWRNAVLATGLISSVPTLVLPFIPRSATRQGSNLQRLLLCFAVGGMMGDVFLHLLPHLLMGDGHHDHGAHGHHHEPPHDQLHRHHEHHVHKTDEGSLHEHYHEDYACESHHSRAVHDHGHGLADLFVPVTVLVGFLLFFVSERLVRGIVGESGHSHSHHHHSNQIGDTNDDIGRRKKDDDVTAREASSGTSRGSLKTAGILNLAADALHNLTDGIAIGAAFMSGASLGRSTALATLLHELPHEIGDYAVLVQSGMSKWQAIRAQFATATAAFAGTAIGLLATSHAGIEKYLLAATAGGFVYVSCVAVMPEILNGSPSFPQVVAEVVAMCGGIALMAGVALLE